jgi:protein TonB
MNRNFRSARAIALSTLAAGLFGACSSPAPPAAPPPSPVVEQPPPTAKSPPVEVVPSSSASSTVRLAPRNPALEKWKVAAAEKIHAVSQNQLFQGRPHHLLKAVIVVEVSVDASGKVIQSKVMRSPGIKSLDQVALASLKAASPLPAPPAALVARGPLVFSETWLFTNDNRFQVRTLALPQE